MPKVNQENLDGDVQEIIIKQFLYSITFLESPKQTAAFFSDFLTDAETIMLSKRLAIAILVLRGHSQTLITKMLSVSYSATGAVSSWLKNADPATMLILNTISQNDDWKQLVYNFKIHHKPGKKDRQKLTEESSGTSIIDNHPEFAPANMPEEMESGDFEALEGPSIITEDMSVDTKPQTGPSMDDLLEDI